MIGLRSLQAAPRHRRYRLSIAACLLVGLWPGGRLQAADDPEYLKAESPLPADLEEVGSPTDRLGLIPESGFDRYRPFRMGLGQSLRRVRAEILPPSGNAFLDDARFSLRPRFYYRNVDGWGDPGSRAAALGGVLALESGWLAETLRISLAGYTSQRLHASGEKGMSGLLGEDDGGYTVLGEAQVELKLDQSALFVGRSRIDLPFINGNDTRMTPNTFEAIGVRTQGLQNMQLGFGHLTKIKSLDSSDFVSMSEQAGAPGSDRGVSVLGLRYNFSDDFHIALVEEYGWDMFNTIYLESDRMFALTDDLNLRVGAQFTDQRSVGEALLGNFRTASAGVKTALGYKGLIASASATTTSDDAGISKPWGGSPSFNSVMIADFDRAGENSIRLGTSFDFSRLGLDGLAADASWSYGDTPDGGPSASPDQQELNLTVDIRPPIDHLENFWLRVRYAVNERDSLGGSPSSERNDFRVILNWSLSF